MSTSLPLWVAIEPTPTEVRLMASEPNVGPVLRARLWPRPARSGALAGLLESLSAWSGHPVRAVLDAAASDVRAHPERWAEMLSQADERHIAVEWVALPRAAPRDRFLGTLGDFRRSSRLISLGSGGVF